MTRPEPAAAAVDAEALDALGSGKIDYGATRDLAASRRSLL